jgi:hypothetical protein
MEEYLISNWKRGKESHYLKQEKSGTNKIQLSNWRNQLIFNYFITDLKINFAIRIEITLYLPKGTLLKPDESMKNYDRTDEDYFYGIKFK